MDTMNRSFIDDNGNPCDDEEEEGGKNNGQPPEDEVKKEDMANPHGNLESAKESESGAAAAAGGDDNDDDGIPKYFINAAELSAEDDPAPVSNPPPPPSSQPQPKEKAKFVSGIPAPRIVRRGRVALSKSYPDIVQTTMHYQEEKKKTSFESGLKKPEVVLRKQSVNVVLRNDAEDDEDGDSLVAADSLENLDSATLSTEPQSVVSTVASTSTAAGAAGGIMDCSALMTESQMCGIINERPPEAWVIDLNSLSTDSSFLNQSPRKGRARQLSSTGGAGGSGASSLSFFVNIDKEADEDTSSLSSSMGPDKKIFSMFVDINGKEEEGGKYSKINKSHFVNKPVVSVMETSMGGRSTGSGSGLCKKFPSPIFQHKAAAEAARKAARMEWEKQREKYLDSLEPSSMALFMEGTKGARDKEGGINMGDSIASNRSSLHVANVLESSFSSSIISSMEASGPGGDQFEICQGGPCFRLGADLLRMFQEGINTDVVISVGGGGKWIKGHKCILASRSQYFAAILSGHWVERAGNTINLDGFSYAVVQFALYHIYSGTNEIPETIDLLELAALADLLGLEGLRENISQTFRVKFCHNFHRPCAGCITGVMEVFPVADTYGMEDLHRKMIKWVCKHFVRIWPTKGFAALGPEYVDKCLRYSISHLSVENILDHTLGCDQLLTTMPTLRWSEPVFNVVHELAEKCVLFLADNLSDVLQSQKFLQFGKGQSWNISRIEGTFTRSLILLKPDMACLSHTALSRLIELGTETIDEVEWSMSFVDFLKQMRSEVEKYLLANASKAVLSKGWEELGQGVRKKICSSSFVGYDKFGNKIVKNTGTYGATAGNPGEEKSSKLGRQGSSSGSNAKVASVRPMQSRAPQSQPQQEAKVVKSTTKTVERSRTMSSTKSDSDPLSSATIVERAPPKSNKAPPKKQNSLLDTTTRRISSPIHSPSCRTPVNKPSTPLSRVPPSKASNPLYKPAPPAPAEPVKQPVPRRPRTHKAAQPPPPVEPPKKTFLNNSAKAAAVSKPILRPVSKTNPPPGPSQQQRYSPKPTTDSNLSRFQTSNANPTFSARSSFSNVERPQPQGRGAKGDVSGVQRRNTVGQSTASRPTVPPSTRSNTTTRRPISGSGLPSKNQPPAIPKAKSASATSGRSRYSAPVPLSTHKYSDTHFDSLETSSYQQDSLLMMSRSTIESDSGEVKVRTLAEIGRSSTFSKDEPTVLRKIDQGSTYEPNVTNDYAEYDDGGGNYDYEDESFDDDE